ncbi:MAG: hypothetical protein ACOC0A_02740, partial [Planctomycetota bacterium]
MPQSDYSVDQLATLALASSSNIGPATINALMREADASETLIRDLLTLSVQKLSRRLQISCRRAEQLKRVPSPLDRAHQTLALL